MNDTLELEGPQILDIPSKLIPIIDKFNDYKIFIIEGGRGSSKTQTIARLLLYIAQQRIVRIFCGRELQSTIEESVYTVLADLISRFMLAFKVNKNGIRALLTSSTFKFKGFREQGSVNIKGIEGADIAWIDEAQSITKQTLDMLLPTLRKSNCKYIFTLNRFFRDDAIMELAQRDDCLHIHIDYFENPHCPITLLDEAERCRITNPRDYNHIWLGHPIQSGDEYLFNFDKLYESLDIQPYGELLYKQRLLGIDWAAQGNDSCVASILDRVSVEHWELVEQIRWDEPDTTKSVGRIIGLIGQHKPDVSIIDIGGAGYNVYCDLIAAGISVHPFDGASTKGIDVMSDNKRADGYWLLKDWFDAGFLIIKKEHKEILKQLEKIKQKFIKSGKRLLESKVDMKKELGYSPDEADSLMMAVYASKYLGQAPNTQVQSKTITRRVTRKRR